MSYQTPVGNPFMLMLNPEVVFAAMASSTPLNQLNRHLCRPLDKATPATPAAGGAAANEDDDDGDDRLAAAAR
jgi:hypothetical protein